MRFKYRALVGGKFNRLKTPSPSQPNFVLKHTGVYSVTAVFVQCKLEFLSPLR